MPIRKQWRDGGSAVALDRGLTDYDQALGAPPGAGGTFGTLLHTGFEWVLAESPGPVIPISSLSQLQANLSQSGALLDLGGNTIDIGSQVELPANAQMTTIQNGIITGGRTYKSNTSKWRLRNLEIAFGNSTYEDNIKGEGGGGYDIVGCNIHNAARQGILLYPHDDVVVRNCRVHRNGTPALVNQDHGIYTGQGSRFLIYNCIFYRNVAYGAQLYPHYHGGLVVCCTFYGSVNRGGVVIGSEGVDVLSNVTLIGCISSDSPWWGYESYNAYTGVTISDCLGWNNGNGDFDSGTWTISGSVHGNPLYVDAANDNFALQAGSAAKGIIRPSLYPYVPATDINGVTRTLANVAAGAHVAA
jgi:hypothetical protein